MKELPSLESLSHLLQENTAEVLVRTHEALEASAGLLEAEAKSEFGTYQQGAGPFAAWSPLADSTKRERVRLGFTPDDPLLRTGDLRDSIEHEVEDWDAVVGSTSPIMPYQEFGTARIPPRPVLGIALQRCWPAIQGFMGQAVASGFTGGPPITPLHEASAGLLSGPRAGYDLD